MFTGNHLLPFFLVIYNKYRSYYFFLFVNRLITMTFFDLLKFSPKVYLRFLPGFPKLLLRFFFNLVLETSLRWNLEGTIIFNYFNNRIDFYNVIFIFSCSLSLFSILLLLLLFFITVYTNFMLVVILQLFSWICVFKFLYNISL